LVTWWSQTFFDIPDSTIGLRTRPWDEVQEVVDKLPRLTKADFLPEGSAFGKGKDKEREREKEALLEQIAVGAGGERLRTVNSLMKKALQQEGSRDVSAILFVALARAIGLGTRLVVSLQAVPWRAEKVIAKKKPGAGRGGRTLASRQGEGPASDDESEDELEEVPIPAPEDGEGGPGAVMGKLKKRNTTRAGGKRRLQDPADLYRLRKPKPPPQTLAAKPKLKSKQGDSKSFQGYLPADASDLAEQPPVFWAEVFSRSDQRWIPVDPIKGHTRKRTLFEPASDNGPIRMLYVVAFEEGE
jgi:xeroderma pigmentosum group C-complementing protein